MPQNNQLKGWILGILGILTLSPDTLIIRLVDSDPWTFIAWRGAFMAVGMLSILSFSYRLQVFSKFFAALTCDIAMSYCVLVLEDPLSLDPAEKELDINRIEKSKEISVVLIIIKIFPFHLVFLI